MEKDAAIELLSKFKEELLEFKKLLIASKHPTISKIASNHDLINELRDKLQTPYSNLRKIIFELGDKPNIEHGFPSLVYDAYEAALEDDNGILFKTLPALDLICKDLTKIRKKLLLVDEESFKKHFGSGTIEKVIKQESHWRGFWGSFHWLTNFFSFGFEFISGFVIKHTFLCIIFSMLILILISFIL